jgi:hypothetical protein
MEKGVRTSLGCELLVASVLLYCTAPALGVVLHPGGEPNLVTWANRPHSEIVGRWSSNASFVAIAPNWIITTQHQSTYPSAVTIGGVLYMCHYKPEWTGGPSGSADIKLVRLTTADGQNPDLDHYAGPYTGTDEQGQEIVISGYGDGRGELLQTGGTTYGYEWDNSANTTLRFGTNRIEDTEDDIASGGLVSDVIIADFDGLNEGQSTMYEGTVAAHDSGGGWFVYDGAAWKVAGLSRAVGVHYEEGHFGDDNYILYQAWFRNRESPFILQPDYLDGVRISSYAAWILEVTKVEGDITADDWVDFSDFAVFATYWLRNDCTTDNDWCRGADFEPTDGGVDYNDLALLLDRWLTGWQY